MTKEEFIKLSKEQHKSQHDKHLNAKRERYRRWLKRKAINRKKDAKSKLP